MTYEEHFQCLSISECKSSVSVLSYIRSRSLNYYLIWFDRDEAVFCGLMFMFMFIRMFIWFCAWTWFCWRVRHIRHTCFFFCRKHNTSPDCLQQQNKKESTELLSCWTNAIWSAGIAHFVYKSNEYCVRSENRTTKIRHMNQRNEMPVFNCFGIFSYFLFASHFDSSPFKEINSLLYWNNRRRYCTTR